MHFYQDVWVWLCVLVCFNSTVVCLFGVYCLLVFCWFIWGFCSINYKNKTTQNNKWTYIFNRKNKNTFLSSYSGVYTVKGEQVTAGKILTMQNMWANLINKMSCFASVYYLLMIYFNKSSMSKMFYVPVHSVCFQSNTHG